MPLPSSCFPPITHAACLPRRAGRDLPPGCLRALSADEKLASLPQYQKLAAKLTQEQVGTGPLGRVPPGQGRGRDTLVASHAATASALVSPRPNIHAP